LTGGNDVTNLFGNSIANIVSCTIDSTKNLVTYTCATGYTPIKYSTSTWLGCVSCGGSDNAGAAIANNAVTGYTCTGTYAATAAPHIV